LRVSVFKLTSYAGGNRKTFGVRRFVHRRFGTFDDFATEGKPPLGKPSRRYKNREGKLCLLLPPRQFATDKFGPNVGFKPDISPIGQTIIKLSFDVSHF
jgi:hypothetical protein